jgi:hypothetical protein
MEAIRRHATELIARRVAPAEPAKDGHGVPYRAHPVFVAQHATAACCRTCLERWHEMPRGRELSADEQAYVVGVICRWVERQIRGGPVTSPPARR